MGVFEQETSFFWDEFSFHFYRGKLSSISTSFFDHRAVVSHCLESYYIMKSKLDEGFFSVTKMSSPQQPSDSYDLVIKSANPQNQDQSVTAAKHWSVFDLKSFLSTAYPSSPPVDEQKLIYAGRLLTNTTTLKDVSSCSAFSNLRKTAEGLENEYFSISFLFLILASKLSYKLFR